MSHIMCNQRCDTLVKAAGDELKHFGITPFVNLRKEARMAVGEVGFHNEHAVRRMLVEKRENKVVNRLMKSKREASPDLRAERQAFDEGEVRRAHRRREKERKSAKAAKKAAEERELLQSYAGVMDDVSAMATNKDTPIPDDPRDIEDDFM